MWLGSQLQAGAEHGKAFRLAPHLHRGSGCFRIILDVMSRVVYG